MRHALVGTAGFLLLFQVAQPLRADEKKPADKYSVTDLKHKEHKLSRTSPGDMEKLVSMLRQGEIEHVTAVRPVNPMDLKWDLGLWAVIVFLLLFFILKKGAWGPILQGLQKREESIRAAVEEAKLARAETERISAEFKVRMDQAYAEIPKMMEEARRDAQVMAEEMKTKAQADIQTERQRLRREIETARDQALKELQDHAANLATLISAKALRRAVSADDHRRLVDEALAELREAGKELH